MNAKPAELPIQASSSPGSLSACFLECDRANGCYTFSYNAGGNDCRLFGEDVTLQPDQGTNFYSKFFNTTICTDYTFAPTSQ